MRAIEAETFSGYGGLRQVELPKPQPAKDRVLVHRFDEIDHMGVGFIFAETTCSLTA
jgi:hypothetical protein